MAEFTVYQSDPAEPPYVLLMGENVDYSDFMRLVDLSWENGLHRQEIADDNAWEGEVARACSTRLYERAYDEDGTLMAVRTEWGDQLDWRIYLAVVGRPNVD